MHETLSLSPRTTKNILEKKVAIPMTEKFFVLPELEYPQWFVVYTQNCFTHHFSVCISEASLVYYIGSNFFKFCSSDPHVLEGRQGCKNRPPHPR